MPMGDPRPAARCARSVFAGGLPRPAGAPCSASLWRSGAERADCLAVRGLAAASPNSLRSLRSLRSDSGDEHVDERAARWPQALCSSAPQRRAARGPRRPWQPGHGWAQRRGPGSGPASGPGPRSHAHRTPSVAAGGARRGRFLARRGAQPQGRCAQRTSSSFWPRLSERRARRSRSEFRGPTRYQPRKRSSAPVVGDYSSAGAGLR